MPQNFSGQNLRGRSFKEQDLEGANFSNADIRGANFSDAKLKNANFSEVKAGLQLRWAIGLVISSLMLSTLLAFFASLAGVLAGATLVAIKSPPFSSVVIILITLLVIYNVTRRRGLVDAGLVALSLLVIATVAWIWLTVLQNPRYITYSNSITKNLAWVAVSVAWAAGGTVFEAGFSAVCGTAFSAVCGTAFSAVLGKIPWEWCNEKSGNIFSVVFGTVFGAVIIIIAWANFGTIFSKNNFGNLFGAIAVLIIGGALGVDISLKALANDEKYVWITRGAIFFAAIGGTNFYKADLTDADFTEATLKSTDFRDVNITRTRFYQTKSLNRVRPGKTYLQNARIRQVLVTGQGQEKNFDREDLRGVNLQGANLVDASFIGANLSEANLQGANLVDASFIGANLSEANLQGANLVDASFIGANLSEANLQDANLSRAKLVQTQLDVTDFTGATLTGAYIQDWGITRETKLYGVKCEYVYMRLPTKENPDPLRKPDNNKEVFADGEFGDFIKPIFDTLDLYHNQSVDPRAIAISFKQLAEKHPEVDLRIVGMEVRGEDKFLLRAKTAATADKSQLSQEYFDNYYQLKGLPEGEIKLLLAEKDSRIRSLENMVITALQNPKFYAENYNNQGDTTMTGDRNINTGGGNYNERIERDYIQGNYYAAGQPQSLAQAAAEIQLLLKQLEQTYPTTTTSQQMVVAAEAINQIESNPTLKKRVINAVKEGGLAAFEKAIDNPAGAFIVGAIKGWQEVEAED
ncbi:hypothetical protein A6S26_33865 [Nostoc sp. ATCC 43529]|nr:hypothetical protein A6S26_33865 [Nostoc sp. ATCC 43529]